MQRDRREFIKKTGMAGIAVTTGHVQNTLREIISSPSMENKIKFLSPVDGDMLNEYDGMITGGGLITRVKVSFPMELLLQLFACKIIKMLSKQRIQPQAKKTVSLFTG
jgi:hypothetical protein